MRVIDCIVCLVGVLVGMATGQDLAKSVEHKAQVASAYWEYSPHDFSRTVQLSRAEIQFATKLAKTKPGDERLSLLLTLNCVLASQYKELETYLCQDADFSVLRQLAFHDVSILAFVKSSDRSTTIVFLERYIGFWKHEVTLGKDGIPLGESDLELIDETLLFLRNGGYNRQSN